MILPSQSSRLTRFSQSRNILSRMKLSSLFFAAAGQSLAELSIRAYSGSAIIGRDSSIYSELGPQLSPNASIILPDDALFSTHQRWQAYSSPTYSVVVEVATEADVQTVVRFANNHSLPFLAVDGAHGALTTLGKMQGGIAISMTKMKGIQISASGDYAELQPGLTNGDLIRYLWANGKQTVTGNCLCTGIMGIMLGGGHGYLQGLFGLLTDQILEARVVLADGSSVVASPSSNKHLFFALRGAGHNFGIVTGLKYKIYDRIASWSEINLIFTQDKLEQVFDVANNYLSEADHPSELILWHTFMRRPDIDPANAVINMLMIYAGPLENLEVFAAPFRALGPSRELVYTSVAYPDLFTINRNDESSVPTCGKGMYRHLMPTYLKRHNTTALRTVHTLFNNITAKYPTIGFTSVYVIEGYSQQAVTAVQGHDTATPYREYPLLTSPVWGYSDPSYSDDIIATSRAMRKAMVEGSGPGEPLRAYLNYGFGDESLAELYGDEPWRVQRLRGLKRKYDPKNRFGFYAPIDPKPGHEE